MSTVTSTSALPSQETLFLVAEHSPCPTWYLDAQGQVLHANAAARQLLASLPAPDQQRWPHLLPAALASPPTQALELSGRFFQLQVTTGLPAGCNVLYLTETTAQVRAERLLAEQQSLTEQILDASPYAVFVRDAQGDIVFENQYTVELRRQLGYLDSAALAPSSLQLQEQAASLASDARVLAHGQQVTTELAMTLASGEQRWFRTIKRLLVRADGERQVLGISADITAQRWALRGLEQREKQYRDLVAYSQALIFTHDLTGRLLSVNPAGATLLGQPAEHLVDAQLTDGILPAYHEQVASYLLLLAEQGEQRGVAALLQPGGAPRYVLYHSYLVREEGQTPYVIGYGQDITERIEAERALKQAKNEAEAAARARENFLANMSHEMRTPLNGVLGMAAQLARTPLDSRQQDFLATIRHAGQHLLHVINDVLDMAKIASGKLELESAPFNLCDSMFEALRPLIAQAEEKGLLMGGTRLRTTCAHPWVLGDSYRLNQILLNLVSNAIKFTAPGGSINVTGEQLSETASTVTVRFSVADTGIGIAPDKQEAIFNSFTQAYADTTRRFGGTGLGLSISRALVQQLGGTLTVSSQPGQGSTFAFTLTLPKAPAVTDQALPAVAYDTGALRGRRVLVVEDNEINRTVARLLLEDWGVVVEEAEDGSIGLERVRQDAPYDLVLMDVQMPGLNGLDATAAIRTLPDAVRAAVPVIALTANAFQADRERCLAVGMQACLAKPFEEEEVYHTLVKALPPPAAYDLDRLRGMARGRAEFVRKIILSFLRNVPGSLAELRAAAAVEAWAEAAKITHHIKPSLESLGVVGVEEAVRLLEAASTTDPALLREAAAHLLAQGARVLAELPRELG